MKKLIQVLALLIALCIAISSASSSPTTAGLSSLPTDILNVHNSDYNTLLSLSTEDYQALSLHDFNAAVKAKIDTDVNFLSTISNLMSTMNSNDDAYSFVCVTLNRSISEIISPQIGDVISFSQHLKRNEDIYNGDDGEVFFSFMFTSLYSVEYRVIDESNISVGERDELIKNYHTNLQKAVDNMDKEQLKDINVQSELQKIADNLATVLSTDTLVFENARIHFIEILDEGQEYRRH